MSIFHNKDVLGMGEVASLCCLSRTKITQLVDAGVLKGFKVPGSTHRRVLRSDLLAFLRAHNMPTEQLQDVKGSQCLNP